MATRLSFVLLFLLPSVARAEPFEVWEDAGTIWTRDLAGGAPWQISSGANCHSPVVDGPLAIWIADWVSPADVMGRVINSTSYHADWILAITPSAASDPRVSYLNLPDEWAYAAWRQGGGIWAKRMRDLSPDPVEVVADYSGQFDLTGRTLTWDHGSVELSFPTPTVPEPSTAVMLLVGLLCAVWHINSRRLP